MAYTPNLTFTLLSWCQTEPYLTAAQLTPVQHKPLLLVMLSLVCGCEHSIQPFFPQMVEYQTALEQRDHIIGQMEAGIKQLMQKNMEAEAKGRKAEEHYSGEVSEALPDRARIGVVNVS